MDLFCPSSRAQWRQWLEENHALSKGIELVYYKKHTGKPSVAYQDAVEEALCFGWIDSTVRTMDEERYKQQFTPRNPRGTWSKFNKGLLEKLEKEGLIKEAGYEKIRIAKENGAWDWLVECEEHIIPEDLAKAFSPAQRKSFETLRAPKKTMMLRHLKQAKGVETRAKRIADIFKWLEG